MDNFTIMGKATYQKHANPAYTNAGSEIIWSGKTTLQFLDEGLQKGERTQQSKYFSDDGY